MKLLKNLSEQGLIHPPTWLVDNTHFAVIMGSFAYGCSSDTSDVDLYGFCIPPKEVVFPHLSGEIFGFGTQVQRFDQFSQHHIQDKDALGGKGRQYDMSIYNIVKYFQLCMENNPNMVDSLFVHETCVLHSTAIAQKIREKRRLFLHKGCWPKFKGYAFSQLSKIRTKEDLDNPKGKGVTGKRRDLIETFGYDCYLNSETEFLTETGWLQFDEIDPNVKIGTVDPETGQLNWEVPTARISKLYTGKIYRTNSRLYGHAVTENHNMLVSPKPRNKEWGLGYEYNPNRANWELVPMIDLETSTNAWNHIRVTPDPRVEEYEIEDEYLLMSGLFLSEGTISFRKGQIRGARVSQTKNGKEEFFPAADKTITYFGGKRYDYEKETIWTFPREIATRLYKDFGHGSRNKTLPAWCLNLSHRQFQILWDGMILGDGTTISTKADVLYTSSNSLASMSQAASVASGTPCSIRGPYLYPEHKTFGEKPCPMYQVYRTKENDDRFRCVDFKNRLGDGWPTTITNVENERVVCFEVPAGTLVTRNTALGNGTAVQGNCKFAYHVVRLLDEVEQIFTLGDLDLMRAKEHMKAIRRGEVSLEDVRSFFSSKEKELEKAYADSKLPWGPDETAIKKLLVECLEMHYGTIEGAVILEDPRITALQEIEESLQKMHKRMRC